MLIIFTHKDQSNIIGQIFRVEFRMNLNMDAIPVLMRVGLNCVLSVPFATSDLQLFRYGLEVFDAVGSSEDNARSNQSASTLVQVSRAAVSLFLVMEDSTHVGPFCKLRLSICEALDPSTNTSHVTSATLRLVRNLGKWRRDEVRIFAAHIQESWALAVLRSKSAKSVSNVNKAGAVSDNGAVVALVVGDTLIAKLFSILSTSLKLIIFFNSSLIDRIIIAVRSIVSRSLLHNIDDNFNFPM